MGKAEHRVSVTCNCGYAVNDLLVDAHGVVCVCIGCGRRTLIRAFDGPDGVRVTIERVEVPR